MLTGTSLDLTPFGPLVSILGIGYWLLALIAAVLASRLPKRLLAKVSVASIVLMGFSLPIVLQFGTLNRSSIESTEHLNEAKALFAERCRTAGEKIVRTADDVDGIAWMKWREEYSRRDNSTDQWKLNDPYGRDCQLEGCVLRLLRADLDPGLKKSDTSKAGVANYAFVETVDPRDGVNYRYVVVVKAVASVSREQFREHVASTGYGADADGNYEALQRQRIVASDARYGLSWDDISTEEDRRHWIAGGVLRVIDLQTNEVMAERRGFLLDTGQGSTDGQRDPWEWAKSYGPRCPSAGTSTRDFVARVLKPKRGG